MNFDFSALLTFLVFLTGGIWAVDVLFFKKKRMDKARQQLEHDDNELTKKESLVTEEKINKLAPEPRIVEYARSFFPVILIVLLLRSFLVEPFRIPSNSMMPTLLTGDFILVNKFAYGLRLPVLNAKFLQISEPKTGDVIVFRYPKDPSVDYIKRVVGVPGDHIEYRNKKIYINGKPIPQKFLDSYRGVGSGIGMTGANLVNEDLDGVEHDILVDPRRHMMDMEFDVPQNRYFVMGDNRDNSNDSRFWGTVPEENLVGRAFLIWMNWDSAANGIAWNRLGKRIE
jgi:signal peptidase I